MIETVKKLADAAAAVMIVLIVGLAVVSIAAVWKLVTVKDVLYKSLFSFSIIAIAYVIIVVATHYWEARNETSPGNS